VLWCTRIGLVLYCICIVFVLCLYCIVCELYCIVFTFVFVLWGLYWIWVVQISSYGSTIELYLYRIVFCIAFNCSLFVCIALICMVLYCVVCYCTPLPCKSYGIWFRCNVMYSILCLYCVVLCCLVLCCVV